MCLTQLEQDNFTESFGVQFNTVHRPACSHHACMPHVELPYRGCRPGFLLCVGIGEASKSATPFSFQSSEAAKKLCSTGVGNLF